MHSRPRFTHRPLLPAIALLWLAAPGCAVEPEDDVPVEAATRYVEGLASKAGRARVDPELQCVWPHSDGSLEAVFGYRTAAATRVELGAANRVIQFSAGGPGELAADQPALFLAGDHPNVFSVRVPRDAVAVWLLGTRFAIAHRFSERCASPPDTGRALFTTATFAGNGRTCATCHGVATGTLSPADVATRAADDPLFRWDGLDDFTAGTTRIREHATILVRIPLPANIRLADDPDADSVVVRRGIPSTRNTPGLDPVLMADGRAPDLATQALGAITGHAQATATPTAAQLTLIAAFEQTETFYSSRQLADFFAFGTRPALPPGTTAAEQRGRRFFVEQPLGPDLEGICALCHSGAMLNETSAFFPQEIVPNTPAGLRFFDVGVSVINEIGNPVRDYVMTLPDATRVTFSSPDPGRALITGERADVNRFKTPTLWGAIDTAPYFHDNSASGLDEMLDHYDRYFQLFLGRTLTAAQRDDVKAYLALLR
jgi:hypothetical protein